MSRLVNKKKTKRKKEKKGKQQKKTNVLPESVTPVLIHIR